MLPYLTDYENDRRLFRPRMVNAILVLLPFMVLYRATELWFGGMYLFEYMKRGHYGLLWAGLCLLSVRRPRLCIVMAYGNAAAVILGELLGEAARSYAMAHAATAEEYAVASYTHKGAWIWLQLMLIVSVLYFAYARQIEPRIKARRERRGK